MSSDLSKLAACKKHNKLLPLAKKYKDKAKSSTKKANIAQYLPKLGLGLAGAGALYGGYRLLKPEPTPLEKMRDFGSRMVDAVGPSLSDFAGDLSQAALSNPALLNAMQSGGMPGGLQAQAPMQMQPMSFQGMDPNVLGSMAQYAPPSSQFGSY